MNQLSKSVQASNSKGSQNLPISSTQNWIVYFYVACTFSSRKFASSCDNVSPHSSSCIVRIDGVLATWLTGPLEASWNCFCSVRSPHSKLVPSQCDIRQDHTVWIYTLLTRLATGGRSDNFPLSGMAGFNLKCAILQENQKNNRNKIASKLTFFCLSSLAFSML